MAKKKKDEGLRKDKRYPATKRINGKKRFWYSHISKEDAERIMNEELAAEAKRPQNYRDITVAQWLDEWLENLKIENLRPKTMESYESNCRVHIKPHIGEYKLAELDTPTIRNFLAKRSEAVVCRKNKPTTDDLKKAKKIKPRTLQYIYVTLNAALEQARKDKIISENPCEQINKPTADLPPINPYTDDEKEKLLKAVEDNIMMNVLIAIALDTGGRLSEFLNLKWSRVNLETGRLIIAEATEQVKGKGPKEAPTKNKTSVRSVKVTKPTLALLNKYQSIQTVQIKTFGMRYQDNDLVFAKPNGTLIPNYEISKRFKKIALAAGLRADAHFHETRHTIASELADAGLNQFKLQAFLGHATLDMTKRYVHLNSDIQDEIVETLTRKRAGSQKVVNPTTDSDYQKQTPPET